MSASPTSPIKGFPMYSWNFANGSILVALSPHHPPTTGATISGERLQQRQVRRARRTPYNSLRERPILLGAWVSEKRQLHISSLFTAVILLLIMVIWAKKKHTNEQRQSASNKRRNLLSRVHEKSVKLGQARVTEPEARAPGCEFYACRNARASSFRSAIGHRGTPAD